MMVSRRRLAAVAAAVTGALVLSIGVHAQGNGPTPQQMKQMQQQAAAMKEKFFKELGVTPAQKAKLTAIDKKYTPQIVALQRQMAAIYLKAQSETMATLTPAQKAKLKQMQAAQNAAMQRQRK